MSNIDNSPEMVPINERSLAIEGYIKKATDKYKENNFQEAIDLLSNGSDQAVEFTEKYNIQIQHPNIPIYINDLNEIDDPKFLSQVIEEVLTHGHGWDSKRLEIPSDIDIVLNMRSQNIEVPPLWKKVQALCSLEEWVHVLDHSQKEESGLEKTRGDELENNAAKYLHNNLQIKLPKYFLDGYNRKSLGIPVEDHDFDQIII